MDADRLHHVSDLAFPTQDPISLTEFRMIFSGLERFLDSPALL